MGESSKGAAYAPAIVLIVGGVLTLAAMLHHPTMGHQANASDAAATMTRLAPMLALVHGMLIALLIALLYGVAAFAQRRGLERPLTMAGLVAFASGLFAMLPAPVLDGFVLSQYASAAHANPDAMMATFPAIMTFGGMMLLAFAKLGTVLISVGIVLFSIGLMHDRGAARWFGLVGVLTVLPAAIAVPTGLIDLNAHGMTLITAAWSVWFVGLGVLMLCGRA
ncbi:MAG: hypothetical protein ABUL73_01990 [Alphaproteobacteria bacterium]